MARVLVSLGLILVVMGVALALLGALLSARGWRGGRLLPGDIVVTRPGFSFVFPIVTSLLVSLVLSLLVWAIFVWRR